MNKNKKILLVDDSRTALMLQRLMLAETGYEVLMASNGRQGVELAIAEAPDLIVMDVVMPEVNGFDAVRMLRAKPRLATTPIIMVTSRSETFSVGEGYAVGCTDYMTKPFDGFELLAKVRAYLDEHQPTRELHP